MPSLNNKVFLAIKFISSSVISVICLANWMALESKFLLIHEQNLSMSNIIKDNRSLFSKLLNHSMTLEAFFHFFVFSCICWLILSTKSLLIFPILYFEGFIKQHEILFQKSSLWTFIVIYVSVSCSFSIHLSTL